jgi:hypothetical protein
MSQRIGIITHLDHMPKATMARSILNRLVERVRPIMDEHDLTIVTLKEFYDEYDDDDDKWMGRNEGMGKVVMIRLRDMDDKSKFLPKEEIIETMLHELTHNCYPDHDDDFESYLQGLRDEYDSKYGPVTWPS